jgi:integrase
MKVGAYLDQWHAWRVSESQNGDGGRKASTLDSESEAIELYFRPGLGHIRMEDLRDGHIRDLYVAMRQINRPAEKASRSDLLRRLLEARASRDGQRISTRPLGESRIRRMHAVLTAALNDAVDVSHILSFNPAAGVFKSKGAKKSTRIRPLLWTAERTERWQETGKIPAKVMVWTDTQCGNFLDFAEATGERLYPLFHLDAYYGPRRGELVGLEEADLSVAARRMHIRQAQADDELDDPKSEKSDRQVIFDEVTAQVLAAWQERKRFERRSWGPAYTDSGRVFTYEDGRPLRPGYVSTRFDLLIDRYTAIRLRINEEGRTVEWTARRHRVPEEAVRIALSAPLPPIRFHDLRHGAASMLRAAKVEIKVISEILGHASTSFTDDVYTVVAEELAEQAAQAISAFVPRRAHRASS